MSSVFNIDEAYKLLLTFISDSVTTAKQICSEGFSLKQHRKTPTDLNKYS